jgi:hypothetical protein
MSIQRRRSLVAVLVAAFVLLAAHWFDAGVLADAQNRAGHSYDYAPVADLLGVARIVTAVGVLCIAVSGWRSGSLIVGAGYAIVGGFLAFLPALVWAFAASVHGAPPVAPQPIASSMVSWYSALNIGVTGAVYTLAAAMFVSGLAVVGSVLSSRRGRNPELAAEQASSQPA